MKRKDYKEVSPEPKDYEGIDKNIRNPHGEKGVGPYACGS
jgi:hypothetical protein